MKRKDDQDAVVQFLAESERNLVLAELMHEHYRTARQQIVEEFYSRLSNGVFAKLKGWTGRYNDALFEKQWGAFNFFKPEWEGLYCIRLEAFDKGKRMIYGVHRHQAVWSRPPDAQLRAAVHKSFPGANFRQAWEAELLMTSPAPDWRTPKTLWRMKTEDGFRAEVEAALIKMAELTSDHLDRMVKAIPKFKKKR